MTSYARLSQRPKQFHALTGYMLEEFQALLPAFVTSFLAYVREYTLAGKERQRRRYTTYQNSPLPTVEDKLLFILMYLRKATTQDIFGEVFDMPQPVVNKWVHILHPRLNQALATLGEIPARTPKALQVKATEAQVCFQDGTERPIQRPKDHQDQKTYYSGNSLPDTFHNRDQKPGFSADKISSHISGRLESNDPTAQTAKNLVSLLKVSGSKQWQKETPYGQEQRGGQ